MLRKHQANAEEYSQINATVFNDSSEIGYKTLTFHFVPSLTWRRSRSIKQPVYRLHARDLQTYLFHSKCWNFPLLWGVTSYIRQVTASASPETAVR